MIGSHKLILQSKSRVSDGEGGFVTTWADVKKVWATVQPLNSIEIVKYGKLNDEISHLVTMRYDKTIKSNNRFVLNNRVLEIKGNPINIDERSLEMEMTCLESFNK